MTASGQWFRIGLNMIYPLIFDLDGTLWDSSVQVAESWTLTGRRIVGPDFVVTPEQVRAEMGKTMTEIVADIVPNMEEEARKEFVEVLLSEENDYLMEHPGVFFPDLLLSLKILSEKGHRLFIVSNCQSGYIETFLHALGPDAKLFEGHLCWGDTHEEKNITIQLLMIRHTLRDAIYIGDTHGDEIQTRKADLPFIHAGYGFGKAESPDASINSLYDLDMAILSLEKYFKEREADKDKMRSTAYTLPQLEELQTEFLSLRPDSNYLRFLRKAKRIAKANGCADKAFFAILSIVTDATKAKEIRKTCIPGVQAGIFSIFLQSWVLFLLHTHIVKYGKAHLIDGVFGTDPNETEDGNPTSGNTNAA